MKIELSGKDQKGIEESIEFKISPLFTEIRVNKESFNTLANKELFPKLEAYNKNYLSGDPYKKREFYKVFSVLDLSETLESLIRAFATSCAYLQFSTFDTKNDLEYKEVIVKENFNDRTIIEWTGESKNFQPDMYFVRKELLRVNQNGILALYNDGFLQRYFFEGAEKIELFFTPLEIVDRYQKLKISDQSTMRTVLIDRDNELRKFNRR